MPVTPITDLGTAVITGIAAAFAAFFAALPSVLGAVILLVIGWIVAGWVGGLLARALRMIRFDQLAERSGVTAFLQRSGVHADPAGVIGGLVKWYVRLVFVLMAANAVGVTAISKVVSDILGFIPNLIVALLILGAFAWLANVTRGFVQGALGGTNLPNSGIIATLASVTVFAFGVVAAAGQIGVAETLVNTLFIGVVAALALAFGLAFGLGGQQQAAEIWRDWRTSASRAMQHATPGATTAALEEAEARRRRDEAMRRG